MVLHVSTIAMFFFYSPIDIFHTTAWHWIIMMSKERVFCRIAGPGHFAQSRPMSAGNRSKKIKCIYIVCEVVLDGISKVSIIVQIEILCRVQAVSKRQQGVQGVLYSKRYSRRCQGLSNSIYKVVIIWWYRVIIPTQPGQTWTDTGEGRTTKRRDRSMMSCRQGPRLGVGRGTWLYEL